LREIKERGREWKIGSDQTYSAGVSLTSLFWALRKRDAVSHATIFHEQLSPRRRRQRRDLTAVVVSGFPRRLRRNPKGWPAKWIASLAMAGHSLIHSR
jgi:hypothetical protein